MDSFEIQAIARVLQYGSLQSRLRLAEGLMGDEASECWTLLIGTVWSQEDWLLRARSLEVLGLAAGLGDRRTAEMVLDKLFDATLPATP
jgi:hypothetical protein